MIGFVIVIICVGWNGGGVGTFATANKAPSSGASSWRATGSGSDSYRRNEDIPIMGDHSLRASRKGNRFWSFGNNQHRRSKRTRKRHTADANADVYDDASDVGDEPPFFFLDDGDNDMWRRDEHEYDRRRRNHHRQNQSQRNNNNKLYSLDSIRQWTFEKTGVHIPRVNLHFDPVTILKIRKSWHDVIPWGIVRVGADFETHRLFGRGVWRLRGCVEDKLIGGRFTIKERRYDDDDDDDERAVLLEYSKSWLFAGSGSIGTRFNLSAAFDLTTQRGSAKFGFRAEDTSNAVGSYQILPGRRKGFCIMPIIPLDSDRRMLLEAKTNIDIPEPEFVIGTDFDNGASSANGGGRSSLGMGIGGDIDVEIEEVNLIFSF